MKINQNHKCPRDGMDGECRTTKGLVIFSTNRHRHVDNHTGLESQLKYSDDVQT